MDNFEFSELNLLKELAVKVTYHEEKERKKEDKTEGSGTETFIAEHTVTNPIFRHADMDNVANELKYHVARVFSLYGVDLYKAPDKLAEKDRKAIEKVCHDIEIITLQVSGEDNKKGMVIKAKYTLQTGEKVDLKTPQLGFDVDNSNYPFGLEVGVIYNRLCDEVDKYLFDKKYGQPELAFDEPSENGEPKEEKKEEKQEETA